MKNFETLVEYGVEQAIAEYVAGLVRTLMAADAQDKQFAAGLERARDRYDRIKALIEAENENSE